MISFGAWAVAALALTHGSLAASCSSKVDMENGGFESGELAPWSIKEKSAAPPTTNIVTPGYQSNYALQLEVAESNFTEFSIQHLGVGQLCAGDFYKVSFAYNWGNYSGPPSNEDVGCQVFIDSASCYGKVSGPQAVFATPGAGWQNYSYSCMAMKDDLASYTVDFDCQGNATSSVPAFTFQLDALNITMME